MHRLSRRRDHPRPRASPRLPRCVRISGTDSGVPTLIARDASMVYIVHDQSAQWRAFVPVNTGPACFLQWSDARQQFLDPCFGARFNRDGTYQEGPAPRNLDEYRIWSDGTYTHNLCAQCIQTLRLDLLTPPRDRAILSSEQGF